MTHFQSVCSGEKLKFLSKLMPPEQDYFIPNTVQVNDGQPSYPTAYIES